MGGVIEGAHDTKPKLNAEVLGFRLQGIRLLVGFRGFEHSSDKSFLGCGHPNQGLEPLSCC